MMLTKYIPDLLMVKTDLKHKYRKINSLNAKVTITEASQFFFDMIATLVFIEVSLKINICGL